VIILLEEVLAQSSQPQMNWKQSYQRDERIVLGRLVETLALSIIFGEIISTVQLFISAVKKCSSIAFHLLNLPFFPNFIE
jgi:hypothetical protein